MNQILSSLSGSAASLEADRTHFLARQPIFNGREKVIGYELLHRSGTENFFAHEDGDQASSDVMSNSLLLFGLTRLVGNKKAFINVPRKTLLEGSYSVLPRERTVIEVLETVRPDEEVIKAFKKLKQDGFTLALDDFAGPVGGPFTALADIIKVDFRQTTGDRRRRLVERFAGQGIQLLAEKVETREEFEEAIELGYSYFQGYFFCKPEIVSQREIRSSGINYMRLVREINQPSLDFDKLEQVVRQELSLSLKLLRYLNSCIFGFSNCVTSIKQALVLLGIERFRQWANFVAFGSACEATPSELLPTCLARARFCELVAPHAGLAGRDADAFLVGLLSVIDSVFGRPMEDVLNELCVTPEIRAALLTRESLLGQPLKLALAYERGNWDEVLPLIQSLGIANAHVGRLYLEAVTWADAVGNGSISSDNR